MHTIYRTIYIVQMMIGTSLAMSQCPDGRTDAHFPHHGRLITQHGTISDSYWNRGTFGSIITAICQGWPSTPRY